MKNTKEKNWVSLGCHQGSATFNRCNEIIEELSKRGIQCRIYTNTLFFMRYFFVEVPTWKSWHHVIDNVLPELDMKFNQRYERIHDEAIQRRLSTNISRKRGK